MVKIGEFRELIRIKVFLKLHGKRRAIELVYK